MEGCGKTAPSGSFKFRIPKKKRNARSDDIHVQSPLSRLADTLSCPLQEWKLRPRNKNVYHSNWKRKRQLEKCCISDEGSAFGQPKVILTNVLKTEIGRKYIKTQLITDANLSHGVKLQSHLQSSSSVESVEIWQILSPLDQSLLIPKRQPKVTLTNILRTKTGRKYVQRDLLTDANLSDAFKLQSDEHTSSSVVCLESCQKISSQQSCFSPKRYGRYQRRPDDHFQKPSKDAESNNSSPALKRCDVVLEDCSKKKKERDQQENGGKDFKNTSPGLREASFQNIESRKRRGVGCPDQWHVNSPQKSPLPSKEQKTEPVQSMGCRGSSENHQGHMHNHQQENILQPMDLDCSRTFVTTNQNTAAICPDENCLNTSPKRKEQSAISNDVQTSPLVSSAGKQKVHTIRPLKEPLNRSEKKKQMTESTEPIVLSSDEEEGADVTESYFQTQKSHRLEIKEAEQESKLHLSEELSQNTTDSKTEQVSTEQLDSSADRSTFNGQMDLALDIKFAMVYIGKYKGTATGCAKFTTRYIKIPFEVALNKRKELSVDSMHLKKIGLWTNCKDSLRSDAVLFLWLSEEQTENQIGTSELDEQEFIFIKLSQLLTEEEQATLNKIIMEVSKKNATPDLTDFLPWEQAVHLLKELSSNESSFMDDCFASFQQQLQKGSTSVLVERPSQESKSSITKHNYALLLRQNSGQYSFSISSAQRNEWKDIRDIGPVRNLIVYPPPPAKGGLGVTREDLECLEHEQFLNDVIIDFYLKYLWLERAPKPLADRSHIFSSFFYKCLTRTEKNSEENPNLSRAQRRHKRVKRWTRHINIFSKDYIFVPVNEESHWYMAVICFPWLEEVVYEDCPDQSPPQSHLQPSPLPPEMKSEIVRTETVLVFNDTWNDKEELDANSKLPPADKVQHEPLSPGLESKTSKSSSKIKKVCKRPCILILDSLKASSVQKTVQVLREYLEVEWETKRKTCREFSKSVVVDICPRVPKQNNNSDCGVYLLQYVETFFQNPLVNFELPLHLERWFPRQVVRSKREDIRNLILQLHLQQQSGSKS
ncbi:sentrin-specific protease 7 isoform X2 [Hemicordylus capensis]|nr:sentrin-specific protease 7 isoform X2 [Hemicordylus capensis]XP_053162216.1 sentrin-specific protease 7 isoform X2 [Hemicordylus capensis]